jgi:hypothetical protein
VSRRTLRSFSDCTHFEQPVVQRDDLQMYSGALRDFTLATESVVNVIDLLPNGVSVRRAPIIAVIWPPLPLEAARADGSQALLSRGNIGRSCLSRAVRWSHIERVASNCPASARRMSHLTFETPGIKVWWPESVRREVAVSATHCAAHHRESSTRSETLEPSEKNGLALNGKCVR